MFPIYVSICGWRSEVHAARGEFEAALVAAAEAQRAAGVIRHPTSLTLADAFMGYCQLLKGDIAAAVPILERGHAVALEHVSPHGSVVNSLYLAYALMLMNRREAGLESLTRALQHHIAFMAQWTRYGTISASA